MQDEEWQLLSTMIYQQRVLTFISQLKIMVPLLLRIYVIMQLVPKNFPFHAIMLYFQIIFMQHFICSAPFFLEYTQYQFHLLFRNPKIILPICLENSPPLRFSYYYQIENEKLFCLPPLITYNHETPPLILAYYYIVQLKVHFVLFNALKLL